MKSTGYFSVTGPWPSCPSNTEFLEVNLWTILRTSWAMEGSDRGHVLSQCLVALSIPSSTTRKVSWCHHMVSAPSGKKDGSRRNDWMVERVNIWTARYRLQRPLHHRNLHGLGNLWLSKRSSQEFRDRTKKSQLEGSSNQVPIKQKKEQVGKRKCIGSGEP